MVASELVVVVAIGPATTVTTGYAGIGQPLLDQRLEIGVARARGGAAIGGVERDRVAIGHPHLADQPACEVGGFAAVAGIVDLLHRAGEQADRTQDAKRDDEDGDERLEQERAGLPPARSRTVHGAKRVTTRHGHALGSLGSMAVQAGSQIFTPPAMPPSTTRNGRVPAALEMSTCVRGAEPSRFLPGGRAVVGPDPAERREGHDGGAHGQDGDG